MSSKAAPQSNTSWSYSSFILDTAIPIGLEIVTGSFWLPLAWRLVTTILAGETRSREIDYPRAVATAVVSVVVTCAVTGAAGGSLGKVVNEVIDDAT